MDQNDRKALSRDRRLSINTCSSRGKTGAEINPKQTIGVTCLKLNWSRQPEARIEDITKLQATQSFPAHERGKSSSVPEARRGS